MTKFISRIQMLLERHSVSNFLWLAGDKGFRMVVGIAIGGWVARYLGAENFGLFAYALAWIAIILAVAPLGMDHLAVRDIIRTPEKAPRLLGIVIAARFVATVIFSMGIVYLVHSLRPDDPLAWQLTAILACGASLQALESGELWFQAKVKMRVLVIPRVILFSFINLIKVAAILLNGGIVVFVVISAVEMAVGGILTYAFVRWGPEAMGEPAFDKEMLVSLFKESYPLALSALATILNLRLTQLMLAQFLDDAALGIYAAATRLTESALFLPMILASSLLPALLKSRDGGVEVYRAARMQFFRINAAMALLLSAGLCICAPWIIFIIYGSSYHDSIYVLMIHSWMLVPVFLGAARGQYLMNERMTTMPIKFTVIGLCANIVLSLSLIPKFGILGAAAATVFTQIISGWLGSFLYRNTRAIGCEQTSAMLTFWKIRYTINHARL